MEKFTVKFRPMKELSWVEFKEVVCNIDEPKKLLSFAQSKTLTQKEFYFLLDRVAFLYSNMRKELFTTSQLSISSRLFKYLYTVSTNLDIKDYCEYMKAIKSGKNIPELTRRDFMDNEVLFKKRFFRYISALNVLIEFQANEVWNPDYLEYLLSLSMDLMKFQGPIAKKLYRCDRYA